MCEDKKLKSNSAALETNSTALNCFNHAKKNSRPFSVIFGQIIFGM